MTNRLLWLAVIGSTLCGCASPLPQLDFYEADAEALRNYSRIEVVDDVGAADGKFRDLGEVEGLYCNRTWGVAIDVEEATRSAIDQVKLRAAGKGADAFSAPSCETSTTVDMTNNCMATVRCHSRAWASVDD